MSPFSSNQGIGVDTVHNLLGDGEFLVLVPYITGTLFGTASEFGAMPGLLFRTRST